MAKSTYNYMDQVDLDNFIEDVLDEMSRQTADGEDIVAEMKNDRKLEDDILFAIESHLILGALTFESKHGKEFFDSQNAVDKHASQVARICTTIGMYHVNYIFEELSNRDMDMVESAIDSLDKLEGKVNDMIDRWERRRDDRRNDRNGRNGRNGRRDDRGSRRDDRNGRNGRRDDRDSGRQGRNSRNSRNGSDNSGTTSNRRTRPRNETAPEVKETRQSARSEQPAKKKQPRKYVYSSESTLTPTETTYEGNVVYNPKTHVAIQLIEGDNVIASIVTFDEAKELNMEPYSQHELSAVDFNTVEVNGKSVKVIPEVVFTKIDELENPESATEVELVKSSTTTSEFSSATAAQIQTNRKQTKPFAVGVNKHLQTSEIPTEYAELVKGNTDNLTLARWHRTLTEITKTSKVVEDKSVAIQLIVFGRRVNEELTKIANDLCALVMGPNASIDNFYADYHELEAALRDPDEVNTLIAWNVLEKEMLRSTYSLASDDIVKDLLALRPDLTPEEESDLVVFKRPSLVVSMQGELNSQIKFSNNDTYGRLNYKLNPDLYLACEQFVKYRSAKETLSPIYLVDGVGCQYQLIATNEVGAPMYIRRA